MVIDFHSHCLPGLDDGSRNTQMSCEMLAESLRQGVDVCVATPHFYGDRQSLGRFLEARSAAYARLEQRLRGPKAVSPMLLLGAEVAWFPGISTAEGLEALCIQGTELFLLELPYAPWNARIIDEVEALTERFHVILAHPERFIPIRPNVPRLRELAALPLELQVNAGSLTGLIQRHRILKLFPQGFLLGSDMHDTERRPPALASGRARLGKDRLMAIDRRGAELLEAVSGIGSGSE